MQMVARAQVRRRWLAVLGQDSRLRLVALLARGRACVSDLARLVGLSQSCTTRHVQALARAGLVASERDGKRVLVRLRAGEPGVPELLEWLGVGAAGAPAGDRAAGGAPAARPRRSASGAHAAGDAGAGRPGRAAGGMGAESAEPAARAPGAARARAAPSRRRRPALEVRPDTALPAAAAAVEVSPAFDQPISDIPADMEQVHPAPARPASDLEDYLL